MPINVGPLEIIVLLIIVLLIFGPKRLPELGRSLGRGMRQFKQAITHDDDDEDEREAITHAKEERPLEGEVVQDRRA